MDFQTQVLEKSKQKPVLVDFWAPWCGPCRVLGPVLETLAEEQRDLWDLVKLNTEEDPELAARYHVRSIPNVKLFYRGEVIGEFVGALPKTAIESWLRNHLPDATAQNLGQILEGSEPWPDPTLIPQLEDFIREHPDNKEALLALAKERVLDHPSEVLAEIAEFQHLDTVEDIRAIGELLTLPANGKSGAGKALEKAAHAVRGREFDLAVDQIIEAVKSDKLAHDALPRRAGVALFRLLRNAEGSLKTKRRLFDMLLD